jgi:uncharacterized protein (TIRG00374 family)
MELDLNKIKQSKALWYGISTAILVLLIIFADVNKFLKAISSINIFYLTLSIFTGLSVFLVWGYIWHSFFVKLGINNNILKSYKILMAGNFMNSVTPLGQLGGEPFMAFVVSENTDATYEKSLSSVISADIVNMMPFLTYTTLGIAYIILFGNMTGLITEGIYAVLAMSILLLSTAYIIWFKVDTVEKKIHSFIDLMESKLGKSEEYIESVKEKVAVAKETFEEVGGSPKYLLKTILVSHLAPITGILTLYLILIGQGVTPDITGLYFTTTLSSLAMFSPTPGGSGTYEAAFAGLLIFFYPGIGNGVAVASAILFRMTNYWPGLLIGYACLLDLKREKTPYEA